MIAVRSAVAALALLATWPAPSRAHDIYGLLKDRAGRNCCNDTDCRAAVHRITPAGVQMLVDGSWIGVPESVIQYRVLPGDTGETGGAHWCGGLGPDGWIRTHCAVLPPRTAASAHR
jgi:hypothetical protein